MSYPAGDPAREDERIELIARHWQTDVTWARAEQLQLVADLERNPVSGDEVCPHPYERWHVEMLRQTRAHGSHVALDGYGGDYLFQVSPVYLADLLRSFRWRALYEEWARSPLRARGWRATARWAVLPLLPAPVIRACEQVRGGAPICGYLGRRLPPWIDARFARSHGLEGLRHPRIPRRRGWSIADAEMHWYLTQPFTVRVLSQSRGVGLREGVEGRSPLYDGRIVDFAIRRPREERSSRGEHKRLLREASRGLLPDSIVDHRQGKTGHTRGFFERSIRAGLNVMTSMTGQKLLLAELGVIDPESFRRNLEDFSRGELGGDIPMQLFATVQTELWLRGQGEHTPATLVQSLAS